MLQSLFDELIFKCYKKSLIVYIWILESRATPIGYKARDCRI